MTTENRKVCSLCFDLILPHEKAERTKLPDGTEIFTHHYCLEEAMEEPEEREDVYEDEDEEE